MSIFSSIREAIARDADPISLGISALTTSTLSQPQPWLREAFSFAPTAAGKMVTPETSIRVSAVYACVRALAQPIAQLPLELRRSLRGGGSEPATDHPLYQLLRNLPNPEMTSQDSREMAMNHLLLRGNSYFQIVRDQVGRIIELWPLHPDHMIMGRNDSGALVYLYSAPGAGRVEFKFNEIWRTIGMSFNGLQGVSPITYARESIGLAMATEEHGARLFVNGAQLATAFEHPGTLSEEGYHRLKDSFDERFAGSRNAFKTIILEEGMKASKLAMTSVDSQFIESRKFQIVDICRFFNVPPHKVQELDRATFNNIEHLTMDFKNTSLAPWMARFESSAFRDLLTPLEQKRYFLRHDTSQLDRADTAALVNMIASGIANTWLNPNEGRAMMGLNPREGGDVYENPNTSVGKEKPGLPITDPAKG